MKKIIISAVAFIMAFSAAGCGNTEKNVESSSAVSTNETNNVIDAESTP